MPPVDYSLYQPNWASEVVPFILNRAQNKCEWCGLENGATAWCVKFDVKNSKGSYQNRSIWFSVEADAKREADFREVKPIKIVLTVAHLDHDAQTNHNVSMERLKALCQICHLRYDAQMKHGKTTLSKVSGLLRRHG